MSHISRVRWLTGSHSRLQFTTTWSGYLLHLHCLYLSCRFSNGESILAAARLAHPLHTSRWHSYLADICEGKLVLPRTTQRVPYGPIADAILTLACSECHLQEELAIELKALQCMLC